MDQLQTESKGCNFIKLQTLHFARKRGERSIVLLFTCTDDGWTRDSAETMAEAAAFTVSTVLFTFLISQTCLNWQNNSIQIILCELSTPLSISAIEEEGEGFTVKIETKQKNLEYLKCEIEQTKKRINKQNFFYYKEDEQFSLYLSVVVIFYSLHSIFHEILPRHRSWRSGPTRFHLFFFILKIIFAIIVVLVIKSLL